MGFEVPMAGWAIDSKRCLWRFSSRYLPTVQTAKGNGTAGWAKHSTRRRELVNVDELRIRRLGDVDSRVFGSAVPFPFAVRPGNIR